MSKEFTRMDAIALVDHLDAANKKHDLKILVAAARAIRKKYMIDEPVRIIVSMANIQRVVARHFGMTVEQLRSESRLERIRSARDAAYHVATIITTQSMAGIGRAFNKDHTTVLHAMKKSRKRIEEDKIYKDLIDELCEKCWVAATIERQSMERNAKWLQTMPNQEQTNP